MARIIVPKGRPRSKKRNTSLVRAGLAGSTKKKGKKK